MVVVDAREVRAVSLSNFMDRSWSLRVRISDSRIEVVGGGV